MNMIEKLREIGEPPFSHSSYREFASFIFDYGGNFDLTMRQLALTALRAPEYTLLDYYQLYQGMNRGGGPLHPEEGMLEYNLIAELPELQFPAFF